MKNMKERFDFKKCIIDYTYIILGTFVLAFAITFFHIPCKISTGGVNGLATVVYYLFNIPLSVTVLIVNLVLFVCGYKILRKFAIAKTIVGIVFLSLFLEVTPVFGSYSKDVFLSSVFGGILVGVGVGLAVLKEGSTGGSDFAALMLNKAVPFISVATFILIIDMLIIVLSGFAFESYTTMFYSAISLYISCKVTDMIVVRGKYAKSVFIISEKHDIIASEIIDYMERGVTGIYSYGCYKEKDQMMLMCIVKSREVPMLMKKIKKIDDKAFTTISEVREVCGEGF